MTSEEKQALIYRCQDAVAHLAQMVEVGIRGGRYSVTEYRYQLMINEIALAALTEQPVISDDTKRMEWLCAHCVEVRYPLMYGSREMFRAQQDSEEWELPHHTTLREQVDAAIANEVQE